MLLSINLRRVLLKEFEGFHRSDTASEVGCSRTPLAFMGGLLDNGKVDFGGHGSFRFPDVGTLNVELRTMKRSSMMAVGKGSRGYAWVTVLNSVEVSSCERRCTSAVSMSLSCMCFTVF